MWILYWVLVILGIIIFVIILRTLLFSRRESLVQAKKLNLDYEKAKKNLADLIKIPTISNIDKSKQNNEMFKKFREIIKAKYVYATEKSEIKEFGESGILYKIKGKHSEKPSVLMSHYDVVGVTNSWNTPPFDAVIDDGYLYGRGAIDTKHTLCGILEALDKLLSENFIPENDIYLAFSGDEEVMGDTATTMVKYFLDNDIKPEFVLDEGGAVVSGVFPGVKEDCAVIGVAEKGMASVVLKCYSEGGHASSPERETPITILAKAVTKINKNQFKMKLTPATKAMYDTLGRNSKNFLIRMIFANLWLFFPILKLICKKNTQMSALMHTTVAFTMASGSAQINVLPNEAQIAFNMRVLSDENTKLNIEKIKKIINDDRIVVDGQYFCNPSPISSVNTEVYKKLKSAIESTWDSVICSPYLMTACSDSRNYNLISENVYRFSAIKLLDSDRKSIHADNERINLNEFEKTVQFFYILAKKL